ncbi:THxN family PEP-CTERM protein [Thioalkalivibrio sp. ALJT]|uniref:THxN family PEP-CTERM protein n=1 Tax=Thioalkalivibrio sp. ALJT TaxID=1158146 RepID=UPI00037F7121|nr:THxN family PEP-CTERM protein [Thioalkalivibrio sp. ALJT]
MQTKTKVVSLAVAAAVTFAAAPASAALVNTWDYSYSLEWITSGPGAPTFVEGLPGGDKGTQVITDSLLSWGGTGDLQNPTSSSVNRSGLEITGSPATGSVNTGDSVTTSAGVTHFNNPIMLQFLLLETATLAGSLTLTPTDPAGSQQSPITFELATSFTETPNTAPCGFDVETVCDDIFIVDMGTDPLAQSFSLDGIMYDISFMAEGLGPLDADTCAAAGEAAGCSGLTTPEEAFTTANFGFQITQAEVPNPAMLTLFGTGLLALGAVARRRNKV